LPFLSFDFFIRLGTVRVRDRGKSWWEFRAIRSTCCTFEITWLDSQFLFLWWTPLEERIIVRTPMDDLIGQSPFSYVEDPRSLDDHRMELAAQTLLGNVLQ